MKILDGGSDADRLNIICVAEGYTAAERDLFDKHACQLANQIEREGWYRDGLLNVHALYVESKESAKGLQADGKPLDTAFRAYYGGDKAQHVISGDDTRVRAYNYTSELLKNVPLEYHLAVLVNCTRYGGRGGGKGGGMFWTYTDARNLARWTSCALHEWGHVLGLADEYGGDPYYGGTHEPPEPNVSLDRRGAKWRHIVDGAVAGGKGYDSGIYHPTRNCRMRAVGSFPFCPVCEDAVRRELEGYLTEPEKEPPISSPMFTVTTPQGQSASFPANTTGVLQAESWLLHEFYG